MGVAPFVKHANSSHTFWKSINNHQIQLTLGLYQGLTYIWPSYSSTLIWVIIIFSVSGFIINIYHFSNSPQNIEYYLFLNV